jgi:hypothetical protein
MKDNSDISSLRFWRRRTIVALSVCAVLMMPGPSPVATAAGPLHFACPASLSNVTTPS